MKVEPVLTYRQPKYPRMGEDIQPYNVFSKNTAIITAMLVISGALAGCGSIDENNLSSSPIQLAGAPLPPPPSIYLPEQEIIQILQYEAENLGVVFDSEQDTTIKYADIDIALDLYNEEKQLGVAILNPAEVNQVYEALKNTTMLDVCIDMHKNGATVEGNLEDGQSVDFLMAAAGTIRKHDVDDLRQAFREFIEWLQAEGII